MTSPDAWYQSVERDAPIGQGELVFDCPVVGWKEEQIASFDEGKLVGLVHEYRTDLLVLTQACDLANDKVDHVVLCEHHALSFAREQWNAEIEARNETPTDRAWGKYCDRIQKGFVWEMSLLNSDAALGFRHRVVRLDLVFTLPRRFLHDFLRSCERRVQLRPPYREHVSQSFARFFMRVGLPTDVTKAW